MPLLACRVPLSSPARVGSVGTRSCLHQAVVLPHCNVPCRAVQALDSQQQDSDGEDEDRDDPPPLAGRSSRRAASVGRDRSRGRGHAADDAMDAEGPGAGEADHPSVPAPSVVSGRRQRTPNRRYGSD